MHLTGYPRLHGLTPDRIAGGASAVLVVAIAWTLAQATWLLWPGTDGRVGESVSGQSAVVLAAQTALRLESVAELSLFGSAPTVAAEGVDAPATELNLTLKGVWAGAPLFARAIIAAEGGEEQTYKVGDQVPGGAVLDEVFPDRVILNRGGRLEALYLPKDEMAVSDAGTPPSLPIRRFSPGPASAARLMPGDVGARLQEYRQRILNDPQQMFNLARMQPVMEDGKLKGYKLSPSKEKQLFREIGLRPGDVVTSVNGLSLSDPAAAGQVMAQVSGATQLTLTVDRGGRQETVVVPVGN